MAASFLIGSSLPDIYVQYILYLTSFLSDVCCVQRILWLLLISLSVDLAARDSKRPIDDPAGFFERFRRSKQPIEGPVSRWKRWQQRKHQERLAEQALKDKRYRMMHRRMITKKLAEGVAKRMRRRSSMWLWVGGAAGVYTIKYLCDSGGMGCQRKDTDE